MIQVEKLSLKKNIFKSLVHLFSHVPVLSDNFLINGRFHVQVLQESLFEAQRILIEEEKHNLLQAKKLVKNFILL
jgi:hypothetical protein